MCLISSKALLKNGFVKNNWVCDISEFTSLFLVVLLPVMATTFSIVIGLREKPVMKLKEKDKKDPTNKDEKGIV
jgi:hypothetical protein